jgi:hypothetical protein
MFVWSIKKDYNRNVDHTMMQNAGNTLTGTLRTDGGAIRYENSEKTYLTPPTTTGDHPAAATVSITNMPYLADISGMSRGMAHGSLMRVNITKCPNIMWQHLAFLHEMMSEEGDLFIESCTMLDPHIESCIVTREDVERLTRGG